MNRTNTRTSARLALLGTTLVAAILFSWGLNRDRTHPYYTAAVHSISENWHDFLYGAFDPSGFITTDKLPGAFWIQASFVRILGFHPWVVLLPQVLAATACVPLLYTTVRRWAGIRAGLVTAWLYALTPITVALARTNIPDALMVFFLVLAAHAFWRWVEARRTAWLAASAWWLGVAFQVKMGQALLAVPVVVGVLYLVSDGGRVRRLVRSAAFTGVVVAVALSWMVFVTLTPASHRPYIDGSTHNSVWEMVFQYNGFGRLGGQSAGSDPLSGGAVLLGAGGPPGLGRLFGVQTAGQISWLIPAALLSLGAGLIARRRESSKDQERAGYLFWGGWFAVYAAAFCTASGIHSYYTATLAPPIAALSAAGLVSAHRSWQLAERGRRWLLPSLLLSTGAWAFAASSETPRYQSWLRWTVAAAALTALVLILRGPGTGLLKRKGLATVAVLSAAMALIAAPVVWASSVLSQRPGAGGGASAAAGPLQQFGGGMGHHGGSTHGLPQGLAGESDSELEAAMKSFLHGPDAKLLRYLSESRGATRYAAAVTGSMSAAGYLSAGVPVLPMGGFTGDAPAPTTSGLASMVRAGSLRFVLLGGQRPDVGAAASNRDAWVRAHCRAVPVSAYAVRAPSLSSAPSTDLYDCAH